MTLRKGPSGYSGDFRAKGLPRLHLSLRTKKASEARDRHAAVRRVFRERRVEMIQQLRDGTLTVERLEAMVRNGEPLQPIAVATAAPNGHVVGRASHFGTVDQVVARYLVWLRTAKRAERTVELAGYQCARFQAFTYASRRTGDYALEDVTRAHILAYQQSMVDAGVPVNTVTTYMSRVSGIWTFARKDEADTAAEGKRGAVPLYVPVKAETLVTETVARDRVLTVEEGNRLLAATPGRLLFFVACGLLAGLRIGEVQHLRPTQDVDLELGALSIQRQPTWRPKTKRSERVVPMSDELLSIATWHCARYADSAWVFPSPVLAGEPIGDAVIQKHLRTIVARAGMTYGRDEPQGVTFHTLRHTFASHAVMNGVDLYTVSKLIGDSLKTVEDVYASLSKDHKRRAMVTVASVFAVPSVPSSNDTASDTKTEQT